MKKKKSTSQANTLLLPNQRYKIYDLKVQFEALNFIIVDVFCEGVKTCEMAIPLEMYEDKNQLQTLIQEYHVSRTN